MSSAATGTFVGTTGALPPETRQVEIVRVRRAMVAAARELGAVDIDSELERGANEREAVAARLNFNIDGLMFAVHIALLCAVQ